MFKLLKKYPIKNAFTLAETLITLVVIGIVASLTIPNLINSYKKYTYVVSLKKIYSQLVTAAKMAPIINGEDPGGIDWINLYNTSIENDKTLFDAALAYTEAMNATLKGSACWNKETNKQTCKINFPEEKTTFLTYRLKDGMLIAFYFFGSSSDQYAQYQALPIYADINGDKGPNEIGRDIFKFNLTIVDGYNNIQQVQFFPTEDISILNI